LATYEEVVEIAFEIAMGGDWKHKRPGEKRPIAEGYKRFDESSRGRRVIKVMVVDREQDHYHQRVWEEDDQGEWQLIHEHDAQLSLKDKKPEVEGGEA
jgi:hypothetical protein